MKNIYKLLAVVLATLLLLCGCGNKEPEIDYNSLVVAPLDITITDCISEEQIGSVMAYPMTLLGVFEDGTQAIYQSDDGMYQVTINLKNERFKLDPRPIDARCDCPACKSFSRAYLRHLFAAGEMLAMRLAVMHNLHFYNELMAKIRQALDEGTFEEFRAKYSGMLDRPIPKK